MFFWVSTENDSKKSFSTTTATRRSQNFAKFARERHSMRGAKQRGKKKKSQRVRALTRTRRATEECGTTCVSFFRTVAARLLLSAGVTGDCKAEVTVEVRHNFFCCCLYFLIRSLLQRVIFSAKLDFSAPGGDAFFVEIGSAPLRRSAAHEDCCPNWAKFQRKSHTHTHTPQ